MAFNHSLEAVISPPVHRLDIREFAMLNPESRVDPNAPTRLNEEITGAGLFLHISLKPTAIALAGEPSLRFGDVNANCLDLKNGARFLLFVDKGLLSLLEAYSYEESWPPPTSTFHVAVLHICARVVRRCYLFGVDVMPDTQKERSIC